MKTSNKKVRNPDLDFALVADRDCGGGREDRKIVPGGFALDMAVKLTAVL